MDVGDVYYRKIDNCECKIRGFFYMYEDLTMSLVYENYKRMMWNAMSSSGEKPHVLFHNDTFDTVENLYTNLYMTKVEYDKLQEHSSKEGSPIEVSRYIKEFQNTKGLWSALDLAIHFPQPTTSYKSASKQESYEGQHAEEPYWREEDLVPSKIETSKKFKLW